MKKAAYHYDSLLADYYTWMCGGEGVNHKKHLEFFREAGIGSGAGGHAVDLGCGSGFQSIPLARLGFNVTGVDLSAGLLGELCARRDDLPIHAVQDDLMHFDRHCTGPSDLIVCMGDTLTHLDSRESVAALFRKCSERLRPEGCLIITYRDLSIDLKGPDRFIPVRSSEAVIVTCVLEYEETRVKVHDLVYKRQDEGWDLEKSAYYKLRLPLSWVERNLVSSGFQLRSSTVWNGMAAIIAVNSPQA